jgi:hypothetical protein
MATAIGALSVDLSANSAAFAADMDKAMSAALAGDIKRLNRDVLGHLKRYQGYYEYHDEAISAFISELSEIAADEKERAKGTAKTRRRTAKKAARHCRGNVVFLSGHPA